MFRILDIEEADYLTVLEQSGMNGRLHWSNTQYMGNRPIYEVATKEEADKKLQKLLRDVPEHTMRFEVVEV